MDEPRSTALQRWQDAALRLSTQAPDWLDESAREGAGESGGPWQATSADTPLAQRAPSARLFATEDPELATIGMRLRKRPAHPERLAAHIIGMAMERGIETIVFSHLGHCGLERFGLRIERIGGASPAEIALQEEELMRFWNIALVIEADEITGLG